MENIYRLKEVLREKGISGKELAEKTGVTVTTISNISTGNSQPKPELILKIAEILNVDLRELFISTKPGNVTTAEVNKALSLIEEAVKVLKGE